MKDAVREYLAFNKAGSIALLFGIFLLALAVSHAFACFGAEFLLGYDKDNPAAYHKAVLLEMYVREKTGIQVKVLPVGRDTIHGFVEKDKIDAAFYGMSEFKGFSKENLSLDGTHFFYYRTKITEDLRFSTLKEAFARLASGISSSDIDLLGEQVRKNGKIRRTVKEFLVGKKLW